MALTEDLRVAPGRPRQLPRSVVEAAQAGMFGGEAMSAYGRRDLDDWTIEGEVPAIAAAVAAIWARHLKFDAADPRWPDRDRFLLQAGAGQGLLPALLRLTGHDRSDDPHARATFELPTQAIGQAFGCAVGLALAERLLAARFGRSLVDHRTWLIAAGHDLASGSGHALGSLAGQLRLEKLTVLWHDEDASEERLRRFAGYGWATRAVAGNDRAGLASALAWATRSRRPTLIACRVPVALAPNAAETLLDAKATTLRSAGRRGATARRGWLKRLARHPQRAEFERALADRLPDGLHEVLAGLKALWSEDRRLRSARDASQAIAAALLPILPELAGAGRPADVGLHEGALAAVSGMAVHGGVVPLGSGPLSHAHAAGASLSLCGSLHRRAIHAFDEAGCGDDMAVVASLRATPNLAVFRPADAIEAVECWDLALRRAEGPSLLLLGAQPVPPRRSEAGENCCARGGYVVVEASGVRHATLLASGPEVGAALGARTILEREGVTVAVVSLACWELFGRADPAYRAHVLGTAPRIGVEIGCDLGWERWLGERALLVGQGNSGESLVGEIVAATHRLIAL